MNKNDLIDAIAGETGCTKADTGRFIDAFVNQVTAAVASGDKVALVGFGTFQSASVQRKQAAIRRQELRSKVRHQCRRSFPLALPSKPRSMAVSNLYRSCEKKALRGFFSLCIRKVMVKELPVIP